DRPRVPVDRLRQREARPPRLAVRHLRGQGRRMTSRLSSLLVRDGVIGVKRMEKAFQRQVLFGGALDTILLEMREISEQRLLQYLSLSSGLPPATTGELEHIDPNVSAICSRD